MKDIILQNVRGPASKLRSSIEGIWALRRTYEGRNQIDFDDMLWLTLQLLQSNQKCLGYYQNVIR